MPHPLFKESSLDTSYNTIVYCITGCYAYKIEAISFLTEINNE